MTAIEHARSTKVLICDDDPTFVRILSAVLGEYRVEVATSGEEALETLEQFCPDLLLLDVDMHDLNGHEVCRRVRKDPRFRFVKIIFVSGRITLTDRIAGYEAGADDYITKPFDSEEFLAKIRVLTRLKTVEEVDQLKRNFMTLISHETRTPLAAIRGMTELLLDGDNPLDDSQQTHFLQRIHRSALRLSQLSEKTLLACRLMELGPNPLPRRVFAVNELAETVAEEHSPFFEECGVTLDLNLEPERLHGNPAYLAKALGYVTENAARFSPKGGTVTVRGSRRGARYLMSVTDQGSGIAPDRLEQIFELFSIKDISHHSAGLGISLALAHKITELHGGTLSVESEPGNGASFRFELPIEEEER